MILDTCGLLAWLFTPTAFTDGTRKAVDQAAAEGSLGYCAVSAWEIAWKHRLGKLPLPCGLDTFDALLRRTPLTSHPADHELWWRSATMDWPHRDPADRLILALATLRGEVLVTNDRVMTERYDRCRW